MRVQALAPEATVECLDERVVGGLSRPGEVQRHPLRIGPQVKVTADELRALVDTDRCTPPLRAALRDLGEVASLWVL